MENIYLIGFAQSLFFVLLILTKKNKLLSDYFLAFFIFLLGCQLFWVYSYYTGFYERNPWILIADIYYWVLLGPTLFVYTQLITTGKQRLNRNYIYLLIPAFIVTIGFAEYIFINGSNFFINPTPGWFFDFSLKIWMNNAPLFYIIIIFLLYRHNRRYRQYYSNSKNIDLKWLTYLTYGFMLFLFLILNKALIAELLNIKFPLSLDYTWPVLVAYIFGIGFFGYKQKGVFSQNELLATPETEAETSGANFISSEKPSYQKSGLNQDEAEQLLQKLNDFMNKEKLYLDSDLNLGALSTKLGTTTHKLSQVINSQSGKNFFEFVNYYRIEEAKNKLKDPENNNYKIISLAYDCGFNTKSTFYSLFKKETSLTPAEFRTRFQKQNS